MEDRILDPANWTTLAMLLAPGFLILGIRARFREGAVPDLRERVVSYAAVSAVYYAVLQPLFESPFVAGQLAEWAWGFLYYFLIPCIVGLLMVVSDQSDWFFRQSSRLGLRLTHHIPAAWDFAFSKVNQGSFLLVTLKDGTQVGGKMGQFSFASSNGTERDLYLEEVWSVSADSPWQRAEPVRGILLCGKDIQMIEIF